MSRFNKEQVFFLATLAIVGWLGWSLWSSPYKNRQPEHGTKVDSVPAVEVSRSPDGAVGGDWLKTERGVFQEPRDWFPLPPVDLERPPLHEPSAVIPHPDPSVGIAGLGAYRMRWTSTDHAFDDNTAADTAASGDESAGAPKAEDARSAKKGPDTLASADEEYQKRYDWLETKASKQPWYGIIKNRDKYTIDQRADEAIDFQRVDPQSGRLQGAARVERSNLKDNGIHLADNVVNRVERIFLEFPRSQWLGAASVPSLLKLAERALALGSQDTYVFQRCLEELKSYLELKRDEPHIHELIADCRNALFDYEGEILGLQEAEAAGILSPGLTERRARWAWEHGAPRRAVDLLRRAVQADPSAQRPKLKLAELLLESGSGDDALVLLHETENLSEDREQRRLAHLSIGESELHAGMIDRAVEEAEKKILTINPEDVEGMRLLAAARFAAGDLEDSEKIYRRLLDAADSAWIQCDAQLGLALTLVRRGELDESATHITAASAQNPLSGAQCMLARAFLYARGNALERAVDSCSQAVRMAPNDPFARYFLGRMLRIHGDFESAATELKRALDLGASFSDLFNELGYLALLDSRPVDSVRYFEESRAREDRPETSVLLAHALIDADRLVEARKILDALHQKKPMPETQLGIAYCAYNQGDSPGAQKMLLELPDLFQNVEQDSLDYAKSSLAEIIDRESKSQWEDFILWRQVGNGWSINERYGITARISTGSFHLTGTQAPGNSQEQWTWLERPVALQSFHEFEIEFSIDRAHQGRAGLALVHFSAGGLQIAEPQKRAAVMISVDATGGVALRSGKNLQELAEPWKVVGKVALADTTVVLGLRRLEKDGARFQAFVDGAPVGDAFVMDSWRSAKQQLSALFFAAADGGRAVDATLKRARMVRYGE